MKLVIPFVLFLFLFCAPVYALDGFTLPGPVLIKLTNGNEIKAESCTQQDDITFYSLPGKKKIYKLSNDRIESIANYDDSDSGISSQPVSETDQHAAEVQEPVLRSTTLGKDATQIADAVAVRALHQQVRNLFYNEQFDKLENMAKEFRDKKSRFPEGLYKLHYFYLALDKPESETEQNYRDFFRILNKWATKYPNSITQRVAEASAWFNYGWLARGTGWASTVTSEGWRIMNLRLQKSYDILTQPNISQAGDCPERFALLLALGRGLGWDRGKFDMIFRSAISFDPSYYSFYFQRAEYLMPRWEGAPGEWQKFAEDATTMTPKSEGMAIYTRILQSRFCVEWKTFDYPGISWEKMKQGFLDMEKEYPDSRWNLNQFALFAIRAHDYETAYNLFKMIGKNPILEIWGTEESYAYYCGSTTARYYNLHSAR